MENYKKYIGKTLNGKYLITELLGSGGMSHVFKAKIRRARATLKHTLSLPFPFDL